MSDKPDSAESADSILALLENTLRCIGKTRSCIPQKKALLLLKKEWEGQEGNPEAVKNTYDALVNIRKEIRELGYDLSVCGDSLVFDGFRNDASLAEGFKRMALFITNKGVKYLQGDENHIALDRFLEKKLKAEFGKELQIASRQHLWYRRDGKVLILSGSDSELEKEFCRLEAAGKNNPFPLLSALKDLC